MVIDDEDLPKIHYWYTSTINRSSDVIDVVAINMGVNRVEIPFLFPRFRSLCFIEVIRDYGYIFSQSVEYINLKEYLNSRVRGRFAHPATHLSELV